MKARACIVLALLVAAACGKPAPQAPVEPERKDRPLAISLKISGDRTGTFSGRVPVTTVRLDDPRVKEVRWFGLQTVDWVQVGRGWKAYPAVNVFGFRGDGTYEIPVSDLSQGAASSSGVASNVRLRLAKGSGEDVPSNTFGIVATPCSVEVGSDGESGSLTCKRLKDPDGTEVSLTMKWSPS